MSRITKRLHLKELRLEHKIPQNLLAEKAGVSPAYLSLVERGKRSLSDKVKKVLIEEFNVDNYEEYEYEVASTTVTNYSYGNKGQLNQGKEIDNPVYETKELQSEIATVNVLSQVINDYRLKVDKLERENDNLKRENQTLKEVNADLLLKLNKKHK